MLQKLIETRGSPKYQTLDLQKRKENSPNRAASKREEKSSFLGRPHRHTN
jgi:hypothetical protein